MTFIFFLNNFLYFKFPYNACASLAMLLEYGYHFVSLNSSPVFQISLPKLLISPSSVISSIANTTVSNSWGSAMPSDGTFPLRLKCETRFVFVELARNFDGWMFSPEQPRPTVSPATPRFDLGRTDVGKSRLGKTTRT